MPEANAKEQQEALERACEVLAQDTELPTELIERLLARVVRAYSAVWDRPGGPGRDLQLGDEATPTDVARVASALLDAAEMELFELAIWQMWSDNERLEAGGS